MTTPFAAGDRIRAERLRSLTPVLAVAGSDTTKTASAILSDALDLTLGLDGNSRYAIDGYLAYDCAELPDLAVSLYGPAGSTGHWGLFPLTASSTGGTGSMEGYRLDTFDAGTTAGAGGSSTTALFCMPHAYIATAGAGVLRVQFSQVVASGLSNTVIKTGSWLRATKIT